MQFRIRSKFRSIPRLRLIFFIGFIIYTLNFHGYFVQILENDFATDFHYPYEGDVLKLAKQMQNGEQPDVEPLNVYDFTYMINPLKMCHTNQKQNKTNILILVKSATNNFDRRLAIRQSWGAMGERFSGIRIETVFVMGLPTFRDPQKNQQIQFGIEEESRLYDDVIQSNFNDVYYNNTIKTMRSFQWVVENCINSDYFLFVDDDYYVSMRNVFRFLRDPHNYPDIFEDSFDGNSELTKTNNYHHTGDGSSDERLFSGYVWTAKPHRERSSKWRVTLKEYQWDKYPDYVTAGAFILSRDALLDMFFVSKFTTHFRFEDIFLGIVALKAKIKPLHNNEFYFVKAPNADLYNYRNVIASHGYSSPLEMLNIWKQCRSRGYA